MKIAILSALILFSLETRAHEDGCDCEHEDVENEARVYESHQTLKESLTEFSDKDRKQIEEANRMLAEAF